MKVRFDPAVKRDPEQVDGMKVHYAPARRQVPRLRWYLVILIVASPLIYLLGSFLMDLLVVKARGQIAAPIFASLYAADDGVVESVAMKSGERVAARQVLLQMERNGAGARGGSASERRTPTDKSVVAAVSGELDRARLRVDLAHESYEKMKLLCAQGAATTGEVQQAFTQWLAALDYQSRLVKEAPQFMLNHGNGGQSAQQPVFDDPYYRSPGPGRVRDVYVEPKQRVERGETLLTLDLAHDAQITAYLDPKYLRYAAPGRLVAVIFPDGTRLRGEVTGAEEYSERPPPDVPDPLGLRRASLIVRIRVLDPIPPQHDVAGLPVTVRF